MEEEEPEEGEEKKFETLPLVAEIFPSSVIVIDGDDEYLKKRVKKLSDANLAGTHYTDEDMARRL